MRYPDSSYIPYKLWRVLTLKWPRLIRPFYHYIFTSGINKHELLREVENLPGRRPHHVPQVQLWRPHEDVSPGESQFTANIIAVLLKVTCGMKVFSAFKLKGLATFLKISSCIKWWTELSVVHVSVFLQIQLISKAKFLINYHNRDLNSTSYLLFKLLPKSIK